jgi:hypothetical protein
MRSFSWLDRESRWGARSKNKRYTAVQQRNAAMAAGSGAASRSPNALDGKELEQS